MLEVWVLLVMGFVWIVFAAFQDLRTREIANWLNLSLVVFALGFRFFYSFFEMSDMSFFYQGLIGLGIFVLLGNLFYYGKMFAGGDAKLMMALGAILPISSSFFVNLKFFLLFLIIYLVVGAVYGFFVSFVLGVVNFSRLRKEFLVQFKKYKRFSILFLFFAVVFLALSLYFEELFYFGILLFFVPYFYLYLKSVDEGCMVKKISPSKLTVGDWLYEDVKIEKKIVKATWDGVSEEDISLLKKKKYVFVRYGIQFAPVFLISFVVWGFVVLGVFDFGFFGIF
jgi:Flp pilus assembly protein protease CpaA